MATKKTTQSRSASGRRRAPSKSAAPAAKPIRREVGAAICLLLALFSTFGYFHIKAVLIDLFCGVLKGLVGYGYYLVPPALLLCAFILAFHHGRPVRLRVTCALLMPLMVSILLHLFLAGDYGWDKSLLSNLWQSGGQTASGGVLGGVVAITGRQLLSVPGTVLLVLVGVIFAGLTAFNCTVGDVVEFIRSHPRVAYEPEELPERPQTRPVPQTGAERVRRLPADIPLDDDPPVAGTPRSARQTAAEEPAPEKKGFFNKRSGVKSPDEVLTDMASAEHPDEPETVIPPVEREPAVQKVTKQEAQQAAEEVTEDIRHTLEQDQKPYQFPPIDLLNEGGGDNAARAQGELTSNRQRLNDTIRSFGIEADIINIVRGPSVTRYEVELDQGVRLNKLTNLADDIALALGATGVRIAPIPDKISVVGIEVPNKVVSSVSIRDVIASKNFNESKSKISFAVGKDIGGQCVVGDIAKLPHLLIAGTTGSGKSVCTNSIITSILYKATPEEVRLIMVDPKMVELGNYNGIPHLLIPVVTDPKKAAGALQWAVTEMMKRYRTFSEAGVRKLSEYNSLAEKTEGMTKIPSVVVIIDELADLMLVAAKEVEESICRVAQMGRAAGMHLVIATQRPSADVITGLMKANIPSRIAFAVASAMESRIILDTMGAEKLVGRGDMLFAPLGSGKPTRVQGCFISDEEVARVVDFVKQSASANYSEEVMHEIEQNAAEKDKGARESSAAAGGSDEDYDELLPAAIDVVMETGQASVSLLQRRLKLGYARAARLVDQMEEKGVVGPFEGSKPRQLLITKEQWQEMQYRQDMVPPAGSAEEPEFDTAAAVAASEEDDL